MNRNQVKGAAKDMAGKAQRGVGRMTGSEKQQVKGTARQVEGKIQRGAGDMQEAMENAKRDADKP